MPLKKTNLVGTPLYVLGPPPCLVSRKPSPFLLFHCAFTAPHIVFACSIPLWKKKAQMEIKRQSGAQVEAVAFT